MLMQERSRKFAMRSCFGGLEAEPPAQWRCLGGAGGRPAPCVTIFRYTILWRETISLLICGEDLFSVLVWNENQPILAAKTFFFFGLDFTFLGRKRTNLTAMTFFVFVFRSSSIFGPKKGWHHEILPLLPPSLATPLPHRLKILHFFFTSKLILGLYW